MPFDEVVWAPKVNSYDIPGSTTLAGTLDSSAPTKILAGDASGFSATPTIPQLNASSHLNQLLGYYNRRVATYLAVFPSVSPPPIMSYVTTATLTKLGAAVLNSLFTNIGTLLTMEGWQFGSLGWPLAAPTTGQKFFGHQIAYLRKILAISGTLLCATARGTGITNAQDYTRVDNPYGTIQSESVASGSIGRAGQNRTTRNPAYSRDRSIINFALPAFVTQGLSISQLGIKISKASVQNQAWTLDCYSMNVLAAPAAVAQFYSPGAIEGHFNAALLGAQAINVNPTNIYPRAGGYMGYLLAGSREFANTPCASTEDQCNFGAAQTDYSLTLTF